MGKNPNFLGSWDLQELPGREVTLTIAAIRDEKVAVAGQSEICTVCAFEEQGFRPMILNVTNKKTLCKLYKTKDTDKLRGRQICIGIERVKAFGSVHDALRIRPVIPQKKETISKLCAECGKPIAPASGMTSAQVAAYTAKKYGRALCAECATKSAKAQEAAS